MKKERIFKMRTKRFGFTLAEVLITLGIIGVVAAMTIPTLISNTNSAKFKSQYKKTLSTLNQAGLMATAQNDLDWASATHADDKCIATEGSFCSILSSTLSGATRYTSTADITMSDGSTSYTPASISGIPATLYYYQLADGSIVAYPGGATANCSWDAATAADTGWSSLVRECGGFIDVNGATLPNKAVKCSSTAGSISNTVGSCVVRNNAADMGDTFPIVFHDGTVEPATDAARYVLNQSK